MRPRTVGCEISLALLDAASALTRGYLESGPDACLLRLFVLDEVFFGDLRHGLTVEGAGGNADIQLADRPVRVFVSYTQSSAEHTDWVKSMASHLRENGIDARLDIWHLTPGTDVAQWMCNELDLADRVLLICDDLYAQKADRRHGGVGWEIRVVQGDLLQSQAENPDKYIPIFVRDGVTKSMPAFLKSVFGIEWPTDRRSDLSLMTQLVQTIYRVHDQAPPLGRPPSFVLGSAR
jgi:TIR domain